MKDTRDGLVRTTRPVRRVLRKTTRTRNRRISRRISRLMMRLMNRAEPIETRHRKKRARSKCVWSRMTLTTPRTAVSACSRRRRGWIRGTSSARRTASSRRRACPRSRTDRLGVPFATARSPSPRRRAARVPCRRTATRRAATKTSRTQNSSAESRRRGAGGPSCPRRRAWRCGVSPQTPPTKTRRFARSTGGGRISTRTHARGSP